MVKLTYIQQQVSNVGQKYHNEVFDPTLVNVRGRIESTLGNRYLSWASRMRMFNEEKNNMFRVLRRGREDGTLTRLEAEAATKYLGDIDRVLLDYSYLKNGVANKETVDLRTQISVNRTSRISNHYLGRREVEITSQNLEQTVQSYTTLPLDTTLPQAYQNVGGVESKPVSYRIANLFRRARSAVADGVKSVGHYKPVRYKLPRKYSRLAAKAIPTIVITTAVGVASLVGGYMLGNRGKASLKDEIETLKQQYSASLTERTNENAKLAGEIGTLKQQYSGLAEKNEEINNLLIENNKTNQLLQEQIKGLIDGDKKSPAEPNDPNNNTIAQEAVKTTYTKVVGPNPEEQNKNNEKDTKKELGDLVSGNTPQPQAQLAPTADVQQLDTNYDLQRLTYFPPTAEDTWDVFFAKDVKVQALNRGKPELDKYRINHHPVGDKAGALLSGIYKLTVSNVFNLASRIFGGEKTGLGRGINNLDDKLLTPIADGIFNIPSHLQDIIFVPTQGMSNRQWYHHLPVIGYILPRDVTDKDVYVVEGAKDTDVVLRYKQNDALVNGFVVVKSASGFLLIKCGGGHHHHGGGGGILREGGEAVREGGGLK